MANVSGLMTGGLYLFLKSHTLSTIGPRDKAGEYENRRDMYKARRFEEEYAESEGGFTDHIVRPVGGPRSLRRVESETSLYTISKEEEAMDAKSMRSVTTTYSKRAPSSLRSFRSNNLFTRASNAFMPRAPERARIGSTIGGHMRKRSYSLFPNNAAGSKSSLTLLPATTYSPADALKPPPSMGNLLNKRHRRDSSLVSSATVQIGLRFSSVEDIEPPVVNNVVSPDHHVYNLDCPLVQMELQAAALKRPAGLDSGAVTPTTPSSKKDEKNADEAPVRDAVKDAKMKTLPPVPRLTTSEAPVEQDLTKEATLSPSVYSPVSPTKVKLPSPRGVGFTVPAPRLANGSPRSPPIPPPQRRGTGDTTPTLVGDSKNAWI